MVATTKPKPASQADLQKSLDQLSADLGGATTTGGMGKTKPPSALGISAANSVLPVTFSLPGAKTAQTAKGGVPGATKDAKGNIVTSYAGAVQALYMMDTTDVEEAKRQLIDSGYLSQSEPINGAVNTGTLDAWKRMALDAADSGTPISTLLAAGGAAPAIVSAQKAARSALQNAETSYASAKVGGVTTDDPTKVKQQLVSAFASIGEPPPSPKLQDAFAKAFVSQQTAAESDQLSAEKQGEGQAISSLQGQVGDLSQGNIAGATAAGNAPGPVIVGSKPMPDLDAETMAQAKASNPAEYLATQSSYLYGLLLNSIRGTAPQQTAPTAPSASAPGGAGIGAPLVAPGT